MKLGPRDAESPRRHGGRRGAARRRALVGRRGAAANRWDAMMMMMGRGAVVVTWNLAGGGGGVRPHIINPCKTDGHPSVECALPQEPETAFFYIPPSNLNKNTLKMADTEAVPQVHYNFFTFFSRQSDSLVGLESGYEDNCLPARLAEVLFLGAAPPAASGLVLGKREEEEEDVVVGEEVEEEEVYLEDCTLRKVQEGVWLVDCTFCRFQKGVWGGRYCREYTICGYKHGHC